MKENGHANALIQATPWSSEIFLRLKSHAWTVWSLEEEKKSWPTQRQCEIRELCPVYIQSVVKMNHLRMVASDEPVRTHCSWTEQQVMYPIEGKGIICIIF
ncbi:hypothetical protein TNCT_388491 [Trichonephila clavata]|uniref:Uncharacterized protein n=1 Tax=Trichonephila clavata TaxID=2740835 RepID=A0A8X6HMN1_TRICU|nr:hypothetical protein TNCT_388491 [Trichonephila clavata]